MMGARVLKGLRLSFFSHSESRPVFLRGLVQGIVRVPTREITSAPRTLCTFPLSSLRTVSAPLVVMTNNGDKKSAFVRFFSTHRDRNSRVSPIDDKNNLTKDTESQMQINSDDSAKDTDDKPKTMTEKLKYLWKNYGAIAVLTYGTLYVGTVSSLFIAIEFDLLNTSSVGMDPQTAIEKVRVMHCCYCNTPSLTPSVLLSFCVS